MAAIAIMGGLDTRSVTVVESHHRIDFPGAIHFTLEAEVPSDMQSVRLYYSVGSRPIQSYTYPTITSRSDTLNARFSIPTDGGNFIPQGVDIEYYYVFTDSLGREIESDRYTLEYLDPRYDWRRLELDDYVLLWHDRPASDVQVVSQRVSGQLVNVKRLFGLAEHDRVKAVIVNGRREANRSFPPISQASRDTHLYAGFAFGDYGTVLLAGLNADTLVHELTHLMLDQAIDSPRARIPAWLNEGLAMYFEWGEQYRESEVRRWLGRGDLLSLSSMGAVPGRPEDVHKFYSQSASIVRFMIGRFGEARMQALLADIERGHGIDYALRQSYGMGIDELDSAWRTEISGRTSVTQIVDPGTLGTSAIIAGAVLTTGVTLGVAWLRQRLDRESNRESLL